MAAKNWKLEELLSKSNKELLDLAISGELPAELATLAISEKEKQAKAELEAAKKRQAVNIAETRLQKDGLLSACPGKPLSGYQAARILSEAAKLVAIMQAEFAKAGGKAEVTEEECRKFGGAKGETSKVKRFRVGGLLVATEKAEHVEFVRAFLNTYKPA